MGCGHCGLDCSYAGGCHRSAVVACWPCNARGRGFCGAVWPGWVHAAVQHPVSALATRDFAFHVHHCDAGVGGAAGAVALASCGFHGGAGQHRHRGRGLPVQRC